MRTIKFFLALLFMAPIAVQAQDLSTMLTEIADGIKPEAYTENFAKNKADWTQMANTLDPNDMAAVNNQVSGLVKGLKGSAFQEGAHKQILKQLGSLGNMSDVGGLLTSLVNGLDPSMLTGALAGDKSSVLQGLADL